MSKVAIFIIKKMLRFNVLLYTLTCMFFVCIFVYYNQNNVTSRTLETGETNEYSDIESYDTEVDGNPINMQDLKMDDPRLISEIRRRFLIPPPPKDTPYFMNNPALDQDPSQGQGSFVREYFNNKRDGFFIELGGLDGEYFSNTLVMERSLGWKGLLIESDPTNLKKLLSKQRHVWVATVCASNVPNPIWVNFRSQQYADLMVAGGSRIVAAHEEAMDIQVQCVPLYSILLAINRTTIDFFSLDIEGQEMGVLQTIPWDKVDIKSFAIEFNLDPAGKAGIVNYLSERGYKEIQQFGAEWMNHDVILVKEEQNKTPA